MVISNALPCDQAYHGGDQQRSHFVNYLRNAAVKRRLSHPCLTVNTGVLPSAIVLSVLFNVFHYKTSNLIIFRGATM
jgi:hypothetical protein